MYFPSKDELVSALWEWYVVIFAAPEAEADLVASLLFHGLDGALYNAIMRDQPIDRLAFVEGAKSFAAKVLLKPNIGT